MMAERPTIFVTVTVNVEPVVQAIEYVSRKWETRRAFAARQWNRYQMVGAR